MDWPWSPWGPLPIQPLEVRTVGAWEEAEPVPEGHPKVWGPQEELNAPPRWGLLRGA